MLKPKDPRYAALPLAETPGEDATLPYVVLCWPISDPLARYRMVKEKGNARLVAAHDAYWRSEDEMGEGNPQRILDAGEAGPLPPAILVQGLADDNVTPDMADRFTESYKARGGSIELHKFEGMPHTFIVNRPADPASARATELIRDFVLKHVEV
jgi:acetyl esterase/lipase